MLVDLIHTTTRDGVRLDGIYQAANGSQAALDAVLCVHGTGSNFYSSTLFDAVGEQLLSLGISVLRVNTRGHDLMSTASTTRGGRRQGAAYELFDDCRHDLAAWIDWLKLQNRSRIGLIGHSAGALKCLYAQAHEPDPSVRAIVALSPPRLSYSWFRQSEQSGLFLNTFQQAQALEAAGEGHTLLEVQMPLSFVVTASGYVEKYGPDERYNFLRFLARVTCPTLLTFGEKEVASHVAFREIPNEVTALFPSVAVATIPQADHFYSGVRDELLRSVGEWLQTLARS